MKEPLDIIYTGLNRVLGSPQEYSTNLERGSFDAPFDLKIPLQETDQKRAHKPDQGEFTSSFDESFYGMSIRSPIPDNRAPRSNFEEQKRPSLNN